MKFYFIVTPYFLRKNKSREKEQDSVRVSGHLATFFYALTYN